MMTSAEEGKIGGTVCGMDFDAIFSQLISGNDSVLENTITAFIDLTSSLAEEV